MNRCKWMLSIVALAMSLGVGCKPSGSGGSCGAGSNGGSGGMGGFAGMGGWTETGCSGGAGGLGGSGDMPPPCGNGTLDPGEMCDGVGVSHARCWLAET